MKRNWIAGGLGVVGLVLIGYAGLSSPDLEIATEPPVLEAREDLPEDMAGEVPLFESAVASAQAPALPSRASAQAADSFATVPENHWILRALEDVFPQGETARTGEFPHQVTRYEMAVSLARAFEYYEKDSPKPLADLSKVALMEKLGSELRQELSMLGVDTDRVSRQLEAMNQRVASNESALEAHGGRLAQLEAKLVKLNRALANQVAKGQSLQARLSTGEKERATLTDRSKAISEVMSRLVVKSSVSQARMEQVQEKLAAGAGPGGADPQLVQRIAALENRKVLAVPAGAPNSVAAHEMATRLKRLERLVVKVYNQKGKTGAAPNTDVAMVRRSIGQLARRLEAIETSGGDGNPQALKDVKGLLKNFFTDFSRRLGKVESQVF